MALFLFPGGLVLDSPENNYRLHVLSLITEQKKTVLSVVFAKIVDNSHLKWMLLGVKVVKNRYLQWKRGLVRGDLIHYCN